MSAPAPLLLIHGAEPYLIDIDARAWLEAARAACASDLNVEVIEQPARLDGVRRSLMEVPFLDDRRYVLVRDAPQLAERARRGADSSEVLVQALQERSPTTSVCVVAHIRIAAGHPVLAAVSSLGGRIVLHTAPKGRDLRAWLERRLTERGMPLPRPAVDHLLAVCGADLGRLDSEIDKLIAYSAGRRPTLDDVQRLVAGDPGVAMWDVVDRLLAHPSGRGAAALDSLLADGIAPPPLIAKLANDLREILEAQDVLRDGGGAGAVARALGLEPWRAERLVRRAGAVPAAAVESWLRSLQELDAGSKAGTMSDVDGLRSVVLRAAADAAGARRGG